MQQYTYSIIIPHKNIPDLLQRCLDSIPQRDDVQVIIVDDNSDSDKVDFTNFPGKNRPNTKVYFDKTGRGAGRARNVGLEHANGKWLLFADADDFFIDNFNDILNEYAEAEEEIIYFNFKAVMSDDVTIESNRDKVHTQDIFKSGAGEYLARISYPSPWGKVFKKSLIDFYKLHFSEVRWSNDLFFVISAGCMAKYIKVINKPLYVVTERNTSLTSEFCKTDEELNIRTIEAIKVQHILNTHGYKFYTTFLDEYMNRIACRGIQFLIYHFKYFDKYNIPRIQILCALKKYFDKTTAYKLFLKAYVLSRFQKINI